jgi:putative inorganic carbon (HCO3(-)) transporter
VTATRVAGASPQDLEPQIVVPELDRYEPASDRTLRWFLGLAVPVVILVAIYTGWGLTDPHLTHKDIVLPAVGVLGLALATLAFLRFEWFLVLAVLLRSSMDAGAHKTGLHGDVSSSSTGTAMAVLFSVSAIWWLWKSDWPRLRSVREIRTAIVPFFLACILSVLDSDEMIASIQFLGKFFTSFMMLLVLERILCNVEMRRRLLIAVLASGIVPTLVGLEQAASGHSKFVDQGLSRVIGTFVQSNPLAIYLTMVLLIGISILPYIHGRVRLALSGLMVLELIVLYFTYTRGAWAALIVGLAVLGIFESKKILMFMGIALILAVAFVPSISARITNLERPNFSNGQAANSLSWRYSYWGQDLKLAEHSPVTGIGIDQTRVETQAGQPPHNDFLRSFTEAGVIGAVAFLWLIWRVMSRLYRSVRKAQPGMQRGLAVGAFAVGFAWLTFSTSGNFISQIVLVWYLYVLVGLGVAAGDGEELLPAKLEPGRWRRRIGLA